MSDFEEKSLINSRVQTRYAELMAIGKHGHYETMFKIVHDERRKAKADGMREAADLVGFTPTDWKNTRFLEMFKAKIQTAASKLDPPT